MFHNSGNSRLSLPLKTRGKEVFCFQITLTASSVGVTGPCGDGTDVEGVMGEDGTGGSCTYFSS